MKTVEQIKEMKGKEKISMLTCYDFSMATLIDGAIDIILIGDSLGMVMLGYTDTKSVTMDDMIRATESVSRGSKNTFIIGDMPIHSYDSKDSALKNAQRFLNAGAHAVKLEGFQPEIAKNLIKNNIQVQGHLGYLPQSELKPTFHGKEKGEAELLLKQSLDLQKAGIFSLVFELLPPELAQRMTKSLSIPTIGIGSGPHCDGQVLVIHDIIGFYKEIRPKFVKRYGELGDGVRRAALSYSSEVKKGRFPESH